MVDLFYQPYGVYDKTKCTLVHIGLYSNELEVWKVFLGWPDRDDIKTAKSQGLCVIPMTVSYKPPEELL